MGSDDNDSLEHWERLLSPAEKRTLEWIKLDPTRSFCSGDLAEPPLNLAKGTARNVIYRLHNLKLIKLYCRDKWAFYILASSDPSEVKKPMTLSPMGGTGLRHAQVDPVVLLESLPSEELCKIHDVHLCFCVAGLYLPLASSGFYEVKPISGDLVLGTFSWSKYRSLKITVHKTDTVSFYLSCSRCPVESSPEGFASMAAFLGDVRKELLNIAKSITLSLSEDGTPKVDDWIVKKWHYGRDSAQEFEGERFNITFKMWCGILARIYVHHQDRTQKIRMEIIQTPNKPLRQVVAEKLNLCCSRCNGCSKQS